MARRLSEREIRKIEDKINADKIVYVSSVKGTEKPTIEIWEDIETGKRYLIIYTLEIRAIEELEEGEEP